MTVFNIFFWNGIHKGLVKIEDVIFFFLIQEEVQRNDVKVGVGKMKTNIFFFFF